jgi:hypothetical protein
LHHQNSPKVIGEAAKVLKVGGKINSNPMILQDGMIFDFCPKHIDMAQ